MNPCHRINPGKKEKTILIVDDEPSVIAIVSGLLYPPYL